MDNITWGFVLIFAAMCVQTVAIYWLNQFIVKWVSILDMRIKKLEDILNVK